MVYLYPVSSTAIRCGKGSCGPPGDGTPPYCYYGSAIRSWPCYDRAGSRQSAITGGSLSLSCGATRRYCCHQDSFLPAITVLQAVFGTISTPNGSVFARLPVQRSEKGYSLASYSPGTSRAAVEWEGANDSV